MPPISKSYISTNDYYMKIGDIIEILMCPIFIVFFFSRQNNISYLCIVVIKNYSVCCGQFKPAQTGLVKMTTI